MRSKMIRAICSASEHDAPPILERVSATPEPGQFFLCAKMRFLPKQGNGSRPIMPTKCPSVPLKLIHDVRLLLQTISLQYREGMDAKASSDFHRKWVDFLRRRTCSGPVFFVHADIKDAFGSILHDRMIEILLQYKDDLPHVTKVRTLTYISPCGRRSRNFRFIPFLNDIEKWVRRLPSNSIVMDLGNSEEFNVEQFIHIAIRSIQEVHVQHNNDNFIFKRGIPQGSRLSSSLCHIYYGHMVRQHLREFLEHPEDLLIRVVDDFLYLTPDYERAERFKCRIRQGFADYNAHLNNSKSTDNLPPVPNAPPLSLPAWPSFCGLQFNTRTLELRGNYSKYQGTDIIHCISPPASKPGQLLLKRLQAISTLKLEVSFYCNGICSHP